MNDIFFKRVEKLRKNLSYNSGILVTNEKNCFYLSGVKSSNITLYISKKNLYLMTDFRYYEIAQKNSAGFVVLYEKNTMTYLKAIVDVKTLYIETNSIIYDRYVKLKNTLKCNFKSIGNAIDILRIIKDDHEIQCMQKAQDIADKAFLKTLDCVKENMSELDLKANLEYNMATLGSAGTSFDTIVLFGEHSSLPHGEPSNKKLANHQNILVDFGCVYDGYCSDTTRTFFFGSPKEEVKIAFDHVLKAHIMSRDIIKAQMFCSDIDKTARDYLDCVGYKGLFGHSLGHGVGLDIHEQPTLSTKSKDILQNDEVFTIEPGVYIKDNYGIRTENMYYLKNNIAKSFTSLTLDMIIL